MTLFLPLLNEHEHHIMSSLLGGGDQHLKLKLSDDDFLSPLLPRRVRRHVGSCPYTRFLSHKEKKSVVPGGDHKHFQVNIDVQQFAPEEISVKCVNDNTIVVECKHEEKQDEHGYIFRHFLRRYKVPEGHDIKKCISKLSSDGVLTITAPKIENEKTEVEIPITFTNQPSQIQNSAAEPAGALQEVQESKKKGPKSAKK